MPFKVAALLITRVISVLDEHHVCVDLGYKAVASESPLPRVFFLNHPEAKPISQSEEHLVLEVPDSRLYPLGSVFYGIPVHICPTVALYDKAYVIRDREAIGEWPIIAVHAASPINGNQIINYQLSINKMNKPFIIDAHLDLSMNALEWNRDLRETPKRNQSERNRYDR